MTLFEDLKWRGLIKDVAGEEADLQKVLDGAPFAFYWGTDPTADSLHLGHYSSLCMAKRLANAGHHPVLLCGGATGRIGDPRPTAEREIISEEAVNNNIGGIRNQIKRLVPTAELVDNYDWWKDRSFLDTLRDIGKYISLNYMLDKDIIRRRLETGITFAEFSYMLLQGFDFVHLFQEKQCIMQVAGSDQWGNITTGVDLLIQQERSSVNLKETLSGWIRIRLLHMQFTSILSILMITWFSTTSRYSPSFQRKRLRTYTLSSRLLRKPVLLRKLLPGKLLKTSTVKKKPTMQLWFLKSSLRASSV